MSDSILSAFPLPPTHIRANSPMLRPGLLIHNPPPTQPPSGPLPPLPSFPSPISARDSLLFLSQPKRGSRRLSSTGSIIGVGSRPPSDHRPPSELFRTSIPMDDDFDAILNAPSRSQTPSSRPLKTAKSVGSALATAAGSKLGSRTSTSSRTSRRKGKDDERSSSPDICDILNKAGQKPPSRRSSSTPGRVSRRKSTVSNGSLGLPGPSSSRGHGSQDSFRSYSPLLPDHNGFMSSPPTSDSEHSDSSIDLHTPLPHLMVRDGLLSPYSKILVNQAALPTPTDPESRAKFLKAKRDARDTEERRTRHRDGKLLRDGVGLTTGLGWSDSEDEGAPSALTRRLSSLDMSSTSHRTSTFSLHSTRSYSSLSSHAQRQRAKLSPSIFSSAPPSAFPKHISERPETSTSYFSPMSPDFPPSPFSMPIKRRDLPEPRSKPVSLPPLRTSLPAVTTNVIEATPRLDPPPAGRSLAPKSLLNLQPLTLPQSLANSTKPPLSPRTQTVPSPRSFSGRYGPVPQSPRHQSSLPTPLTSPVPAIPSIPQGRRTPSSMARLSVASSSSAGSERIRTLSTASSTGSSVLLPSSANNSSSSSIKRSRALSNASSIVSTTSSRGQDSTAASTERRQRTLSTASNKSNGSASASRMPVPALPTSRPPSTTGIRQPATGTGMQYRSASRSGTVSTPTARASLGSSMVARKASPSPGRGTPVPSTRLSAPSNYSVAKRPSIVNMRMNSHNGGAPLQAMAI